jgi:Rieske Fe-S protein
VLLQGAIGAAVLVPWLGGFAFPLWGKVNQRVHGFVPVGPADRFPVGKPVKVTITGEGTDAWRKVSGIVLGAAWVIRGESGSFEVFSTTCPHLGCSVNHDGDHNRFLCPCHGSHFSLNGARLEAGGEPNPSPRDMDTLEWKVDGGQLYVSYERFRTGEKERVRVG